MVQADGVGKSTPARIAAAESAGLRAGIAAGLRRLLLAAGGARRGGTALTGGRRPLCTRGRRSCPLARRRRLRLGGEKRLRHGGERQNADRQKETALHNYDPPQSLAKCRYACHAFAPCSWL